MDDETIPPIDRMIDNRVLIKEIKKHQCLYDKLNKDYHLPSFKQIKWREVAKIVFAKYWNKWSTPAQDKAVEFSMKRWHNLRNCFLRELRLTAASHENGNKLRRQYKYFKHLIFLKDYIEKKEQYDSSLKWLASNKNIKSEDSNQEDYDEQTEEEEDEEENECQSYEYLDEDEVQDTVAEEEQSMVLELPSTPRKRSRESLTNSDPLQCKKVQDSRKSSILNDTNVSNAMIGTSSQLSLDQDLNFALSLVPMLRELPPADKIDVKIKILSIFKQYQSAS